MTLRPLTLVTGASSGIGAALAGVFAEKGHTVALVARRSERLVELAERIASRGHPRPLVIATDIVQPDAARLIDRELSQRGYEVQFLINNAGIGAYGSLPDMAPDAALSMIALNIRAPTALALHWLDPIVRHRGGILNVASTAAFMPRAGMTVYHATKAYLLSLTEALHHELAADGVRVCALCPGPVMTEFFASAGTSSRIFPKFLYRSPDRVARDGYDGLMAGRTIVIPGYANKILCQLPRIFPRGMLLAMLTPRNIKIAKHKSDQGRTAS